MLLSAFESLCSTKRFLCCLTVLLLTCGTGYAQMQPNRLQVYLSAGSHQWTHQFENDFPTVSPAAALGWQLGASYQVWETGPVAVGLGLELGAYKGSLSVQGDLTGLIGQGMAGYEITEEDGVARSTGFLLSEDLNVRQDLGASFVGLTVPIQLQLWTPRDDGGLYLTLGPKIAFRLGQGVELTGSSTFMGDFSDYYASLLEPGDEFSVVIDDLPEWGFTGQSFQQSEDLAPAVGSGIHAFLFVSPEYHQRLGSLRLIFAPTVQVGLGNFKKEWNGQETELRREGSSEWFDISAQSTQMGSRFLGMRIGLGLGK